MKWRYIPHDPNEYLKDVEYTGYWWTNTIPKFQIQLRHDALVKLMPSLHSAITHQKPYTFFITDTRHPIHTKWRKITSKRGAELYISQYGNDVWTAYDPAKIGRLATNSVSTYYDWDALPAAIQEFICREERDE